MKYDEYLWAKISFVMAAAVICFAIIWAILHPASPLSALDEARDTYARACTVHNNGVPNIASNNPKEWTCQTR